MCVEGFNYFQERKERLVKVRDTEKTTGRGRGFGVRGKQGEKRVVCGGKRTTKGVLPHLLRTLYSEVSEPSICRNVKSGSWGS